MPHVSTQEPSSRPFRPRSSIMPWELNRGPNTALLCSVKIQCLNHSSSILLDPPQSSWILQAPWSWVSSCPVLALQRVSSQWPAWQGQTTMDKQRQSGSQIAMPKWQIHSQVITQASEGLLVDTQKKYKPQQDPQMASFGLVHVLARLKILGRIWPPFVSKTHILRFARVSRLIALSRRTNATSGHQQLQKLSY